MTPRSAVEAAAGVEATSALRLPPPEEPPPPLRWGQWVALLAGVVLVVVGVLHVVGVSSIVLVGVVAGGVVAVAGIGFCGWRANQRRIQAASLASVVGQLLRAPVVLGWVRWRGIGVGRIVRLRVQHTDLAAAVYGAQLGWRVAQAVEQVTGRAFVVRRQRERLRQLVLVEKPAQAAEQMTELEKQRARVADVATESFGVDATVAKVKTTDTLVSEFTVHYRAAAKAMTVPAARHRATVAVGERLTGMWKAQFALEDDLVVFKRRPPLPTYVARPATPAPQRGDDAYSQIPQGVDEDGQMICWDMSGAQAHCLKSGKTRTGKTVTIIGDALECARRGMPVFVIDPKRVEFMGLRSWPNVQFVATTVTQQIAVIYKLKREMDERYRLVEEEGFSDADFEPMLLIIDEYRQLYGNVQAWWKSIKVGGMPAECPVLEWIGGLLRMAAYCRIHVDLATQRPDTAFLAGEQRDNFSARAATGRLSPDGAEMMFGSAHVGVNIPLNVRGRGTIIGGDDKPKEVQFFYTPDPRRPRHDDDRALLASLRPAETRWPALALELPDPASFADELSEGKKTNLEWEQLLRARFEPISIDDTTLIDLTTLDDTTPNDGPAVSEPAPAGDAIDRDETAASDGADPGDDLDSSYLGPSMVPAGMVSIGDLLNLDDAHGWVTITDHARDDTGVGRGEVQLEWRDDDGAVGALVLGRGELLEIRRPKS